MPVLMPRNRTVHTVAYRARSPPGVTSRKEMVVRDMDDPEKEKGFLDTSNRMVRKQKMTVESTATGTQAAAYGLTRKSATSSRATEGQGRTQPSKLNVVVRKRPPSKKELDSQSAVVVSCKDNSVVVTEPKLRVDLTKFDEEHTFHFDHSFDDDASNERLYEVCVRPLVDSALNIQAKCTCFAYGQTGSGKTFTMMGGPPKNGVDEEKIPGVFLLAARDIFSAIDSKEHSNLTVCIAFYEIYCGKLYDLLNNRQVLQPRENAKNKVVIVGLQEQRVRNGEELMEVIEYGLTGRTTGVTGANVDSSRSHAILQISLKQVDDEGKLIVTENFGKLSFIDLAGSERGADTIDQDKQTRMDGAEINKSLLALKECIRALDQQLDHTPFRGSRLTQVLKDSFIGDKCFTIMIANVSPCAWAVEHSLNTLRYAYRVKELRRHPEPRAQASREASKDHTTREESVDLVVATSSDDDGRGKRRVAESKPPTKVPETIPDIPASTSPPQSTPSRVARQGHASGSAQVCRANSADIADPVVTQPILHTQVGRPSMQSTRQSLHNAPEMATALVPVPSEPERPSLPEKGRLFERVARIEPETETVIKVLDISNGSQPMELKATRKSLPGGVRSSSNSPSMSGPKEGRCVSSTARHTAASKIAASKVKTVTDAWCRAFPDPVPTPTLSNEEPEVALEPVDWDQIPIEDLARVHDRLIGTILAEEEEMIASHRQHIDQMVELIKEEMSQLNTVDRPGSDVEAYCKSLDATLQRKIDSIVDVRQKVSALQEHLRLEEEISNKYLERSGNVVR